MRHKMRHLPVLMDEVLDGFAETKIKVFFDGTLGAGGHARALLEAHPEIETYIGVDRDGVAQDLAKENLAPYLEKVVFVRENFAEVEAILAEVGVESVDGFFLTSGSHRCNSMKRAGALASKRKEI